MDGLFFGRLDYQDKTRRLLKREMEMVWMGSANLGKIIHVWSEQNEWSFTCFCSVGPVLTVLSPNADLHNDLSFFMICFQEIKEPCSQASTSTDTGRPADSALILDATTSLSWYVPGEPCKTHAIAEMSHHCHGRRQTPAPTLLEHGWPLALDADTALGLVCLGVRQGIWFVGKTAAPWATFDYFHLMKRTELFWALSLQDDPRLHDYNVDERVKAFIRVAELQVRPGAAFCVGSPKKLMSSCHCICRCHDVTPLKGLKNFLLRATEEN